MLLKILVALGSLGFFAFEIAFLSPKPQQGYVITKQGDTIACIIKRPQNSSVYYKPQGDTLFHRGDVGFIKEYKYTGKQQLFKAITIPATLTPVYMQLIDSGKISLFAFHERIGKQVNTHLFAIKGNQPVVQIFGYNDKADNKTSLSQLVNDNQQATDLLTKEDSYTVNKVTNCIRLYNGGSVDAK